MRSSRTLIVPVAFALFTAVPLGAQAAWTRLYPTGTLPLGRVGHAMARDTVSGRVCMFGGQTNGVTNEFWRFDGTAWTQLSVARPGARMAHAMAFDERRGHVVLFGGTTGSGELDETWEWDGTGWSQRLFAVKPQARVGSAMAYDPVRQRILLFGGDATSLFGDTWEYDGLSWTQRLPVSHPGPRVGAGLAYDPITGHMLLFGGQGVPSVLDETWSWDGTTWTQETPATPPFARAGLVMATDTARARVVLFGGDPTDPRAWEWNGTQWSATSALGPASRDQTAMAYDPGHRQVVLFSGTGSLQDTWVWRTPSPATFTAYGSGCGGSAGVPVLANAPNSLPWLGDTFRTRASGLAASSAAVLFATGLTSTPPIDLTPYGMPGCSGLVAVAAVEFRAATAGLAEWSLTIPNSASLNGASLYQQAFVLEQGANAAGVIVTNGGAMTVGIR